VGQFDEIVSLPKFAGCDAADGNFSGKLRRIVARYSTRPFVIASDRFRTCFGLSGLIQDKGELHANWKKA